MIEKFLKYSANAAYLFSTQVSGIQSRDVAPVQGRPNLAVGDGLREGGVLERALQPPGAVDVDGETAAAERPLARRVADLEAVPALVVERMVLERHGQELLLARHRHYEDTTRREEGLEAVAVGRVEAEQGRETELNRY